MFKLEKFVIIIVLAVFVIFSFTDTAFASDLAKDQDRLTAKSSPKSVIIGAEFDRGLILTDYLTEGFETWFPPDWTRIINNAGFTWNQTYYSSYEGSASAEIVYDPAFVPQDEWMITPTLDFSNANNELQVEFYFLTSYYWHVDPFDNGDMQVRISTDDGDTWSEPLWTEDDYGLFENWVWYQVILELDEYVGEPLVKMAFVYQGVDGAQANFDAIIVSDGEGPVYEHDVGVVEFVSPGQNGYVGEPITPEVAFGNFGSNEETFRATVLITLDDTEVYEEAILHQNLPAGDTTTISFPDYTPLEEAVYTLTAISNLPGDENPDNDTLVQTYDTRPTDIEDTNNLLPSAFNLEQNYPNPFNASTEISFTLPKAADIDLSVYNMLGQKVAALASGMMDAGYHSVNWNAADVTSGIYFYRLDAGDNCEVRKMTLLK